MESVKKYHELPTNWVKIWIGLGVACFVFGVIFLLALAVYVQSELERKGDCDAGIRTDCDSSLIWALQGIEDETVPPEEEQENLKREAEEKLELEYENGIREYRTSEDAPEVIGVEIRGTDFDDGWYTADAGTEIEIIIRPEGDFEDVQLYVHPKVSPTPGVGIYEGVFNEQADGSYLAVYRLPQGLEADLEARIVGSGDDYGSAFIQIRSR